MEIWKLSNLKLIIVITLLTSICNFTNAQIYLDITVQEAKQLIADEPTCAIFTILIFLIN